MLKQLWIIPLLFSLMPLSGQALSSREGGTDSAQRNRTDSGNVQRRTFSYRMAGRVRLLFFWVGKDNVGGGNITYLSRGGSPDGVWSDGVEVLFGSIPERVPGKVNRWGFAREWAYWQRDPASAEPILSRSVFEGFMRHSSERSLAEARSREKSDSGKPFRFDSSLSQVFAGRAWFEKRIFSGASDFDYRNPQRLLDSFQNEVRLLPPVQHRQLNNRGLYQEPYGFLTAVRESIEEVASSPPSRARQTRFQRRYIYNAKTYALDVENVHETASWKRVEARNLRRFGITRVVRADFKVTNLNDGASHRFSVWFPSQGPLKGVPLRILDKPRWWLRIELNLDFPALEQHSPGYSSEENS